jgi:hypothetical protein
MKEVFSSRPSSEGNPSSTADLLNEPDNIRQKTLESFKYQRGGDSIGLKGNYFYDSFKR